jgi:pilus assembly protein CpaB
MKSKTLILMVVAIGCGLVASYMTSRLLAERPKEELEKVTILVAKQNIAMATLIKEPERLFEEKQFTKGEEPKRAIRDFAQLKDRRLNKPINAEAFVTPDDLNEKGQGSLEALMQKGMRAVALKVQADTATSFILPHSHVDIVSVVRRNEGETFSKIILQNVLVLAVDTISQKPDDKTALVSSTITVEVTPQQAEKLALAKELGTLQLIMRSYDDQERVTTAGVTPKGITSGNEGPRPDEGEITSGSEARPRPPVLMKVPEVPPTLPTEALAQAPPPPPKTHTMTIYNGETVTRAVFTIGDKSENDMQIEKSQPDRPAAPRPSPAKP